MMVDDGVVPEFACYGGYITIVDRMRFFTNEAKAEDGRPLSAAGVLDLSPVTRCYAAKPFTHPRPRVVFVGR
jgi:hypothetical protein